MVDKKIPRPGIGVGALIWRDKQILLGKRLSKKQTFCWQFPGGHLETGESVIQCAKREIKEETSLVVKNLRHLGFTDTPFIVAQHEYITLFVSCEFVSGEAKTLEPDKCEAWQWFDYQKLPSPLFLPIDIFLSQQIKEQQKDLYEMHRASSVLRCR